MTVADIMTNPDLQQVTIDGETRLYAIIGDPIAQVKSPRVLNPRFVAAGMDAVMVPVHVKPDHFDATVKGLMSIGNLDGIIVTVPYKTRILPLLDHVLPMAAKVGAANALRRESNGSWSGDMFDGRGLVRGLRSSAITLERRRIMLVGAGGVGSALGIAAGALTLSLLQELFSLLAAPTYLSSLITGILLVFATFIAAPDLAARWKSFRSPRPRVLDVGASAVPQPARK